MTEPPILRIDAVTRRFGAVAAVDGVSLDVAANEFLALLGPSGCGKTTLLRMIAGLEQPDAGRIFLAGADITPMPPFARPVNMMFQSYALFPHMSVADNVAFGLKQEGIAGADLDRRVNESLALVEMSALAARRPHQLSGGQKQRVALARCLAKQPKVLLLDEPMAALDKHLRERTRLELVNLRARLGITFIVVTHDQDEAMTMADRVAVMDAGRIIQVASPRELYERPGSRHVAGFFGDVNLWEGSLSSNGQSVEIVGVGTLSLQTPSVMQRNPVSVALRPEQIAISSSESAAKATLNGAAGTVVSGTVADVVYLGATSTYFVRLPAGATVRVTRQNAGPDAAFPRGNTVFLAIPSAAVVVLAP